MTKVRLTAPGWENFTGNLGFQAEFKDGVSVNDMTLRQIARIGSSTTIVDAETGEQVGPAADAVKAQLAFSNVTPALKTAEVTEVEDAAHRDALAKEDSDRKAKEAAALADAKRKAEEAIDEIVIYSRIELEAMAANNGIQGLRDIAKPLDVKGTSITGLIAAILNAQTKLSVV